MASGGISQIPPNMMWRRALHPDKTNGGQAMKKRLLTGVAMVGSALLIVSAAALFLVSGEMSIGIMESFRFPEFLEIY